MTMTEDLINWTHEQKCRKAVASLVRNEFTAQYCSTPQAALEYIIAGASDSVSIGFGGSMSIASLGVEPLLRERGKVILNHGNPSLSRDEKLDIMRSQLTCDLFLCGSNAVTLSGELVNIDGIGNRVASMIFGPRKVIVVAGRNKLVDGTVQDAITRIKNWATPPNAKRLNYNTPCSSTGFCSNCNSPERICRATTIIDRKPRLTDLHVLIVNADLGL